MTIDGVDYTGNAKSVLITGEEDADATTFAGRAYKYNMIVNGLQDELDGTLYDLFWTSRGEIVPFVVTATATGRAVSGTARMPDRIPDFGGDAFAAWTFDGTLEVIDEPVRAVAPAAEGA